MSSLARPAPHAPARFLALILTPIFILVLAGCGGAKRTMPNPLHVTTTASFAEGPILVRHITYTTFDGERVPALFSIPRAVPPRGCLIWQHGLGGRKENVEPFWDGAARLGLAMFAIDLRDHGQRASSPTELRQALGSPAGMDALITGTIKDLRRAMNYLWSQPLCRHNIGFMGFSFGGAIGANFVAQDPRVRLAVLMSFPPNVIAGLKQASFLLPAIRNQPAQLRAAVRLLSPLDPDRWLGRISPRPLLLLFGTHDPFVPQSSKLDNASAAREPKTVVIFNGGHNPFVGAAARGNAERVADFLLRYLVEPSYGGLGHVITSGLP